MHDLFMSAFLRKKGKYSRRGYKYKFFKNQVAYD